MFIDNNKNKIVFFCSVRLYVCVYFAYYTRGLRPFASFCPPNGRFIDVCMNVWVCKIVFCSFAVDVVIGKYSLSICPSMWNCEIKCDILMCCYYLYINVQKSIFFVDLCSFYYYSTSSGVYVIHVDMQTREIRHFNWKIES